MKKLNFNRKESRDIRHKRISNKLKTVRNDKPRLIITKSNSHLVAQIFDDKANKTLASSSTIQLKTTATIETAKKVGADIATKALKLKIKEIAFDRGGNKYHGQIKALAEAAREKGLVF